MKNTRIITLEEIENPVTYIHEMIEEDKVMENCVFFLNSKVVKLLISNADNVVCFHDQKRFTWYSDEINFGASAILIALPGGVWHLVDEIDFRSVYHCPLSNGKEVPPEGYVYLVKK